MALNMHQIICRLGLRPIPRELIAYPRPLAAFKGPTFKGRGGDERERERKGGQGERGGEKVSGGEREGR